jgi:hypothetical protein
MDDRYYNMEAITKNINLTSYFLDNIDSTPQVRINDCESYELNRIFRNVEENSIFNYKIGEKLFKTAFINKNVKILSYYIHAIPYINCYPSYNLLFNALLNTKLFNKKNRSAILNHIYHASTEYNSSHSKKIKNLSTEIVEYTGRCIDEDKNILDNEIKKNKNKINKEYDAMIKIAQINKKIINKKPKNVIPKTLNNKNIRNVIKKYTRIDV